MGAFRGSVRQVLAGMLAVAAALVLLLTELEPFSSLGALAALAAASAILAFAARVIHLERAYARLRARSDDAVRRLEALYEVGLATASLSETEAIARVVVDHATELLECDGAMLSLAEGERFVVRALRKYSPQLRDSVGEPLAGIALEAIETRDLVVAERYRRHRYSNPRLDDVIGSAIAAPLIAHGTLLGTLTVYSNAERTFDEPARRSLRLYAAQAAAAIANARLLEDSGRLASDDPLTGLLNRRMLVEHLDAEIPRATRHGEAFCVVLCDIDGLKEVNDACGHLVGDEVLRLTAACLRASTRAEDVVARFGGDEFVLLLPRTGALAGQALIARTAAKLRTTSYAWGGRDVAAPRVSMGLASFPDDGLSADTLIAAADGRMYADKARARRDLLTAEAN